MRKSKKIKIKLYECSVHFIVSDNLDKEATRLLKKYKEEYDEEHESCEGYTFNVDMLDYYLIISDSHLSTNTIAHEVYHLVSSILHQRDIKDEEAGAWLCGMLMDEAVKFYTKHQENGFHRPVRKVKSDAGGTEWTGTHHVLIHQSNDN
jgi:hypothetical protein